MVSSRGNVASTFPLWGLAIFLVNFRVRGDDCKLTPVIHVLQHPGCNPISIPSFACVGKCTSYVQVSGSKIWQTERSCMCCQESGEREIYHIIHLLLMVNEIGNLISFNFPIKCIVKSPKSQQKFHKVVTKAPFFCMCRPCTPIDESSILPMEMVGVGVVNNEEESPFSMMRLHISS